MSFMHFESSGQPASLLQDIEQMRSPPMNSLAQNCGGEQSLV
jgi:hypothetical protein